MQKTTLVILAAGIGSRFGQGIKQLTPVGPSGELIIDYSIHDALEAGFDKVVFIIRRDLEEDFKAVIGRRIEALCEVAYVYQELNDLPEGFTLPEGRTKPWGTGQAVLVCRGVVEEPFLVINADDYYGKEAFVKIFAFLTEHASDHFCYCMAGFVLKNTLSENGGVTRGVCKVDEDHFLTDIVETAKIVKCPEGAHSEDTGEWIDPNSFVSMNMWGLTPEFLDLLGDGFAQFLSNLKPEDQKKAEYLLPNIIGGLLKEGKAKVACLETDDKWFGVTYAEDRQSVQEAFAELVKKGVYTSPLT
ncbi:MAG: NTP transferase domain-containing protein [Lachnospiraceae bacterium]|nr:NTP transferase domain-containing protein [Lachnospiraceae bacterium]